MVNVTVHPCHPEQSEGSFYYFRRNAMASSVERMLEHANVKSDRIIRDEDLTELFGVA